jgi:hypothetical protein
VIPLQGGVTFRLGGHIALPITSDKDSLVGSNALSGQVAELIQLLRSGEEDQIQQALRLAKSLGKPAAFQQYLEGLPSLYQFVFKSKRKKLDAAALAKLFQLRLQLTKLDIQQRGLTALPESLGELHHLQKLYCDNNQLQALPESLGVLQNLRKFDCSHNQLQTLPESLGRYSTYENFIVILTAYKYFPKAWDSYVSWKGSLAWIIIYNPCPKA